MKKTIIVLLFLVIGIVSCGRSQGKKDVVIKINNYQITRQEFEQEFKDSLYAKSDSPQARKEFLEYLISRKLILQDAQNKGLDKDAGFLKMVERFWEQSLLKLALDNKAEEISGSIKPQDKVVKDIYQRMVKEGKTDQSYENIREQIRKAVARAQGAQLMNQWLQDLRSRAIIKVDDSLF